MSPRLRLVIIAVLAATVVLGHVVRGWVGVDELSPAGVRAAIGAFGWHGPLLFFLLVVFRQFLAMPAWLVLAAGGLCFGTAVGTALGAAGVIVSGALKFWIARWVGRDWFRARFGERFQGLDARVDRLGPVVIGLSTAHPFGILSWFHWGAGLSSLSFAPFVLAIVIGAPVRSFARSTLGASLADGRTTEFWIVALVLLPIMTAPLALPSVRRRLLVSPPAS